VRFFEQRNQAGGIEMLDYSKHSNYAKEIILEWELGFYVQVQRIEMDIGRNG
jgi:hypothetical protein